MFQYTTTYIDTNKEQNISMTDLESDTFQDGLSKIFEAHSKIRK